MNLEEILNQPDPDPFKREPLPPIKRKKVFYFVLGDYISPKFSSKRLWREICTLDITISISTTGPFYIYKNDSIIRKLSFSEIDNLIENTRYSNYNIRSAVELLESFDSVSNRLSAMFSPVRNHLDYTSIGRKLFLVESLPEKSISAYVNNIDEE